MRFVPLVPGWVRIGPDSGVERRSRPVALLAGAAAVLLGVSIAAGVSLARRGEAYVGVAAVSRAPGADRETAGRAAAELAALAPRGIHVVVDTFAGRLRVYDGESLLREAVCSTGSGFALRDPRNGRLWVFETPLGEHRVRRKVVDPVWSKPDWAFVEEGRLPPPAGHPDRLDRVSLGDYALYLGDGYLIHGTIFQTTLGQKVTHGCIRLGDEDLAWVYRVVPTGAPVWIH